MTVTLEGSEWSAARPGSTLPPGKTRYPFYRRLGCPQGRSGRAENLVPAGIRSRTFQPVAQSLYRLSYPAHTLRSKVQNLPYELKFSTAVKQHDTYALVQRNRDKLNVYSWWNIFILVLIHLGFYSSSFFFHFAITLNMHSKNQIK